MKQFRDFKSAQKFAKTHRKLLEKLHLPSGILRTYSLDNAKKDQRDD